MALDLPLSDEQRLLQTTISRFLADHPRPGWHALVDRLGLAGVAVPAPAGFGGGAIDLAIAAEALGPALAGADWLSHSAACWVLGRCAPAHPLLAGFAAGTHRAAIICPASAATVPVVERANLRGGATLVVGAAEADWLLVADPAAILLVAAGGASVEQRHRIMHDGSVTADLTFTSGAGEIEVLASGPAAQALADEVHDMILGARCAETVGLMAQMVAASIDYLGQRQQFGRPIGSFQVLRHRIADMQLALMKASALTEAAVSAVDARRDDRGAVVSAACVEVADAVRIVGEGAVQIHGAMGLTEELRLGGQFKRALAIASAMGPQSLHRARFAAGAA